MRRSGFATVWAFLGVATACSVEDRAISLPRDAGGPVDAAAPVGCDGACRPDPPCPTTYTPPAGGLSAWFDASCLSAGRLRRWADRSAAQHDARSPSEVASPEVIAGGLGGANAVHFDGVGQYFTLPDGTLPARNGAYTVIVAGSWDDIARTYNGVVAWGGAYGVHVMVNPGGHMFQWWGFGMRANITTQVVFDAAPQVLTYRYDSAGPSDRGRWSHFANGVEVLSSVAQVPNAVSSTMITLGRAADFFPASNPMLGYIGEMFIYERALDDAEVGSVSAYLARKWAP